MAVEHHYIALPKHSPKILIPQATSGVQSSSFMLYSPCSTKGKLLKAAGKMAARLGLLNTCRRFFSVPVESLPIAPTIRSIITKDTLEHLRDDWETALNTKNLSFALSLSSPDRFQKVTAALFNESGRLMAVAKIGCTPHAQRLIEHEHHVLKYHPAGELQNCIVPAALAYKSNGWLTWMLQSVLTGGRPSSRTIQKEHLTFLSEMAESTSTNSALNGATFWKRLKETIGISTGALNPAFTDEPYFINELLESTSQEIDSMGSVPWPLVSAHGDFAPWNMRMIEGKVAIYDWEYFVPQAPGGWDLMRFMVMVAHLLNKQPFEKIYQCFISGKVDFSPIKNWEALTGLRIPDRKLLAKLFMADMALETSRTAISRAGVSYKKGFKGSRDQGFK